jgi:predicted phosphodiesterase
MPAPLANPPRSKPMAFFSDVRGNTEALEAVLAEVARRAIVDIYSIGNHVFGGADPVATWMRLSQASVHMTRGMQDLALVTMNPEKLRPTTEREAEIAAEFRRTQEALGDFVLTRIRKLPERIRLPLLDGSELVACHGSPSDNSIELTHDLDDEELVALLADDPADIVVAGGAFTPFQRDVAGVRFVNVGSVSIPETRSAYFFVVTPRVDGTLVEEVLVEY